jgi:hypothetical protein
LQWKINAQALEEWQLLEVVYVLKTDLSTGSHPPAKALAKYKIQRPETGRRELAQLRQGIVTAFQERFEGAVQDGDFAIDSPFPSPGPIAAFEGRYLA